MRRGCLAVVSALVMACAQSAGSQTGDAAPAVPADSSAGDAVVLEATVPDSSSMFDILAEAPTDAAGDGAGCTGPELCDGLDNNCDGVIDDGCNCQPGRVSSCYRGPASTRSKGQCSDGTMTCVGSGEFGKWGPCTGDVLPGAEVCDPAGVDENCSGTANEGCECSTGAPPVACGSSSVGGCKKGTQECVAGKLGPCVGAIEPKPEECNNIDDDCDGTVDEDLTRGCGSSTGACKPGTETCAAGAWGACLGGVKPTDEKCNNVDDDCDGAIDDGVTAPCGSSVGECKPGVATCTAGVFGACVGEKTPAPEVCDGLDNNCNGAIDESCACKPGETRVCGSSVGECRQGTETCSTLGAWGACTGAIGPAPETCNGRDDNCDGAVDEGGVCPKLPPTVTCPGALSGNVGTPLSLPGGGSDPDGGSVTYLWTVSTKPTGSTATPATPTAATTTFTPDVAGTYTLQLCVTDDEGARACCTVTINATSACTPPTAPAASTCGTSWDRRPIIEFTPVPTGITYQVFKSGDSTPLATITTAGQNHYRPAAELSAGAPPPGESASFYVKACRTSEPTCCVNSAAVSTRLVEACTMSVAASASNLIFSEYVVDGDGTSQQGEAIEITNLSHCPVNLGGTHFSYCNKDCAAGSVRYMNFGATEIIPPRGVYVAIREPSASKCDDTMPAESAGLFGLKISTLAMQGDSLGSGWFENTGGGSSKLRIATGSFVSMTGGTTIALLAPYIGSSVNCEGIGFNAVDACGEIASASVPSAKLTPNQLGRLWHPCDSVVSPVPSCTKP